MVATIAAEHDGANSDSEDTDDEEDVTALLEFARLSGCVNQGKEAGGSLSVGVVVKIP